MRKKITFSMVLPLCVALAMSLFLSSNSFAQNLNSPWPTKVSIIATKADGFPDFLERDFTYSGQKILSSAFGSAVKASTSFSIRFKDADLSKLDVQWYVNFGFGPEMELTNRTTLDLNEYLPAEANNYNVIYKAKVKSSVAGSDGVTEREYWFSFRVGNKTYDQFNSFDNDNKVNVSVFPNPVNNILNIDIENYYSKISESDISIDLLDENGNLIISYKTLTFESQIDISCLKEARYIVKIKVNDQIITKQIIVRR